MGKTKDEQQGAIVTREREEIREPSLYKVLLHNDDYTSMEFVVAILENIFGKTTSVATKIMLDVHQEGVGVAGVYTREIGETKIELAHHLARNNGFPLRCSLEKI
jgi:ATP-dependent Clp protease adaptor protein ClpS